MRPIANWELVQRVALILSTAIACVPESETHEADPDLQLCNQWPSLFQPGLHLPFLTYRHY